MIILLEGGDGVGKTTLAKKLVDELGADYLHFGIPDRPPLEYWFVNGLEHVDDSKVTVIDRLHLSEDAYGAVYRNGSNLSDLDRWALEGWLLARGSLLVHCALPWGVQRENLLKVADKYHDEQQSDRLRDEFNAAVGRSRLPRVNYDYTASLASDISLRTIRERARCQTHVMPGQGTTTPSYWLVAERPNAKAYSGWGAGLVLRSSSGDYLRRALEMCGTGFDEYRLSNAITRDGIASLEEHYTLLGHPDVVVALGKVADRELTRAGVPHNAVPHPQYWRRFHHHDLVEYTWLLREVGVGS